MTNTTKTTTMTMIKRMKMMTKIQLTIPYVDVDCLANGDYVCNVSDEGSDDDGDDDC